MKCPACAGLSLVLLASAVPMARAGGFSVAEQSAVAGGTAGAGTARADDASAAWYNPAALTDDGGIRIGVGLTMAMPSIEAQAMDGSWSTDSESGLKTPPHLYLSHSRDRLAYGISVGVPFGGGVSWPKEWQGRHEIVSSNLQVFRIAPFGAWKLGRVSLSAGPHLDLASLRIRRGLDFVDTEGQVDLAFNAVGIGAHLSAYYQASDDLALGLTYKSRTKLSYSGQASFEAPDEFSAKTTDQRATTEQTLPDRLIAGARFQRDRVAVLADLELTAWSTNDQLVIDFENEQTPDAVQNNRWRSTLALRAGAEFQLDPAWVLRAGGFFDPTPVKAETLAPSSPDSSRLGLSAGTSHKLGKGVNVDAFYEYMHLLDRETADMDALQASYGGQAHFLGLGLRFQQ